MTIASHLQELRRKHETLSEQVEAAQRSPATDDLKIAELKKQKLRLKEEIDAPQPGLTPSGAGPRRQRRPAGDQDRRDERSSDVGCAMPASDQGQRGQQRRGIGGDAQKLDVAPLHPDVPGEEGEPHRPDAQAPATASPAQRADGPDRVFQRQMRARATAPPWQGRRPSRFRSAHRPAGATATE